MSDYSLGKEQVKKWKKGIKTIIKCLQDQNFSKDTHDHNACIEELEEIYKEMRP